MQQSQGKKKVAAQILMFSIVCLLSRSTCALSQEGETLPSPTDSNHPSTWKKTIQVMEHYSDLSFRLQENQRMNELAIAHYKVLRENLKMQVSGDIFQQIRGFRKYSALRLNPKWDVKLNMIKSRPLTSKDTRILQNMTHFTTLEDSKGLNGKGVGVQFTYRLE